MAVQLELKLLTERVLPHTANPHLLAYCPSMELLAIGDTDQQVSVYRLNGQRVYSATQRSNSLKVDRICWKPNGQMLAVAWSDGVVRLVGAESSKNVHQIATGAGEVGKVTCLGWGANFTGKRNGAIRNVKEFSSWKEVLERRLDESEDESPLDLPRDLSLIDVESSLPKLSVLPAGGTSEDIFSSRASLDGLFAAFDPKDNDAVDVMVVGTVDGRVHLSIYDSFVVGSFSLPKPNSTMGGSDIQMVMHASHKYYSTHGLVMTSGSGPKRALSFVPMDLRFVSGSSEYLSLLASKSTSLQNLLRYVHQVEILMSAEWQATQDLPSKFLRNINETLQEKQGCDIVQAMYHSVVTGHTFPVVREWLIDELAERGHKRWDKAVTSGLENLRKLVHENMLPALERCALILSRLAGIVKYQGPNDTIGLSRHKIDLLMDTLASLSLVSARILSYVVDELDMFAAFSGWLRHEIDRLASSTSSSQPEDIPENETTFDHIKVLLYIQTAMTTSRLSIFFSERTSESLEKDWESANQGQPIFEFLDKQLHRHGEGLSCSTALPRLDLLCNHLSRQATSVFHQIAEAEKRNVLFGQPTALGVSSKDSLMAMTICSQEETTYKAYIALVSAGHSYIIRIISVEMCIENGVSVQKSMSETAITFENTKVVDVAFLDDQRLLVLRDSKEKMLDLLSIPYQCDDRVLTYHPLNELDMVAKLHSIDEILASCERYSFPGGTSFAPDKLEVRERKNRYGERDASRLCVLDQKRLHYKVFTIPVVSSSLVAVDEDISMT